MKVLKGIALGIICFFLFLSLLLTGLVYTLNNTALNPDFIIQEIEQFDYNSLLVDILEDQIPSEYGAYTPALQAALIELKPWIDEQIEATVIEFYDYLLNKSDSIEIYIPLKQPGDVFIKHLTNAYLQAPPPGSPPLTRAQVQNRIETDIALETGIEITPEFLGTVTMNDLNQIRNIIGYIKTGFYTLIGIAILMLILIALILRDVKNVSLTTGIIFLIAGVMGWVSYFIIKTTVPDMISMNDLPVYMQSWISQVTADFISPMGMFNLVLGLIGAGLLIVALVFRKKRSEAMENPMISADKF